MKPIKINRRRRNKERPQIMECYNPECLHPRPELKCDESDGVPVWVVVCPQCGAEGGFVEDFAGGKDMAIDVWNDLNREL